MSEQTKILQEMQELIMVIIESGSASEAQADKMDELEDLLYQQKCFEEISHSEYSYLGEEIANLFLNGYRDQAIAKLHEFEIIPEDFFGFVNYHYEDENEAITDMFTNLFIANVDKKYREGV